MVVFFFIYSLYLSLRHIFLLVYDRVWCKHSLITGHGMNIGFAAGTSTTTSRRTILEFWLENCFGGQPRQLIKKSLIWWWMSWRALMLMHSWLDAHSTTKWAKHMFSEDALTDTIVNNMCESFNSRILKFRSKPIISMVWVFVITYS